MSKRYKGAGAASPAGEVEPRISFVTPAWLAAHSRDPGLRVLDVRRDFHAYIEGHVPGAVHLAEDALRGPKRGVPVQFLPSILTAEILARAGVTSRTPVVVYSNAEFAIGASMVAYVLERLGHRRAMILDGGWSDYAAAHPTTQAYPSYRRGLLAPMDVRSIRVELPEVRRLLGDPSVTFVDARPEPSYSGEVKRWVRNGHIPGARSLDWHLLVEPGNPHKIRPREELRAVFASRGLGEESDMIFYCGTGREASIEYVIARHVLGFPKVRLYEGSWTEYSAHFELPIATGPDPFQAGQGR
ncbi:MAG: sulfurtransferase [Polyangiaceae bacterium]|nr:sulfurtransferase [Polyangiaceae bacterium]